MNLWCIKMIEKTFYIQICIGEICSVLFLSIMWTIIQYESLSLLDKEMDERSEILWASVIFFISISISYDSLFSFCFLLRHVQYCTSSAVLWHNEMRHMYWMNDVTEYLIFFLIGSNWQMVRIENCSSKIHCFSSSLFVSFILKIIYIYKYMYDYKLWSYPQIQSIYAYEGGSNGKKTREKYECIHIQVYSLLDCHDNRINDESLE
jgi:hypothetical protein